MRAGLPFIVAVLAGCSAPAAQPPAEPSAESAVEPATTKTEAIDSGGEEIANLDEAAQAFDRAERSLGESLALLSDGSRQAGAAAASEDQEEATGPRPAPPPAAPFAADRCTHACRALDSMTRSAGRLCELTGQDDPRCQNVEQRLGRARENVSRTCPSCAP